MRCRCGGYCDSFLEELGDEALMRDGLVGRACNLQHWCNLILNMASVPLDIKS